MARKSGSLFLLMLCLAVLAPSTAGASTTKLHFFYAENCAGCQQEKPFVTALQQRYPQLQVQIHDVWRQRESYQLMEALAKTQGIEFATTPATAVGQRVWFGYNEQIAGQIAAAVQSCQRSGCLDLVDELLSGGRPQERGLPETRQGELLPFDPEQYSLPAFTLLIGLLDSFNPCAFFVLLFLLSLMVHTHSRARMLLIGGVFICASGVIYFLFMAAWLNLFLLAGQLPWLTTFAGLVALLIAGFNIKDYFYLHHGPSLSLKEAAKPKLITRMRELLKGERLLLSLVGTLILALVANSYELLCTAGFPIVYTRILTLRELPLWSYYLYLGLYNLAYVAPLLLIVVLFAFTLGRHKLSEFEGRLLKLASGVMMLALGLVLLLRPLLLQNLLIAVALLAGALLVTALILFMEKYWLGCQPVGGNKRSVRH